MKEKEVKKYFALIVILIILVFLAFALSRYISAIFGALIFFYLFDWLYKFFKDKVKINKHLSAIIVIFISLLIIIIPTYFFLNATFNEVGSLYQNRSGIINSIQSINEMVPEYDLTNMISQQISTAGNWLQSLIIKSFASITHIVISLLIMYFILYYLFISPDGFKKKLIDLIPFNKNNSRELIKEFKNITHSTIVTSGLIAVMQGLLISLGFIMFGLDGALLWGFVGAIISFLPVLGTGLVWIPASLVLVIQNKPVFALGMFIWGLFLSNLDNIVRPNLQRRIGRIHPLITLIGIFIGIPYFGLLGIIVGPLLLSYFILMINMFREEYLNKGETIDIFHIHEKTPIIKKLKKKK